VRLFWRSIGIAAWITVCTAMVCPRCALAEGSGTAISAGGAYSPTNWGGDRDGAAFIGVGLWTEIGSHWALRFQLQHGRYTDYPDAGRVYFTPVGVGPRYWAFKGQTGPFLQCLPTVTLSKWGGGDRGFSLARIGIEVGAGINLKVSRGTGVEVGAAWIHTDDFGTIPRFDVPPAHLDALSVAMFRAEFSVRLDP
jgi:hypothetical protein